MNIFFYITFPVKLALSLLTAIPKKGNLSLPKNYRGIQMLKSMAALYDRIIMNHLEQWIINIICNEQSAYRKGSSTIYHLFTIRILIEIARINNVTLYIRVFDSLIPFWWGFYFVNDARKNIFICDRMHDKDFTYIIELLNVSLNKKKCAYCPSYVDEVLACKLN